MKTAEEYREEITRFAKSDPCPYCGKTFKPRGLGTHIREAHGVKIKTVVRTVVRTVVPDKSTVVPDSSTVVPDKSTVVPDSSTRVQRPSDYVKKRSEVIETRVDPVFKSADIHHPGMSVISDESWALHQRIMKVQFKCKYCGHYCVPDTFPDSLHLNTGCLPGKQHEV